MEKTIEKLEGLIKLAENSSNIRSKDLQPFVNPNMLFAYYEKEETIIPCGQKLSEIIYIVKGEFILTRNSIEGNQVMIARVWGPDFLGIPQLVTKDKIFYSQISAITNCLAFRINLQFFKEAMMTSAFVSYTCVKSMASSVVKNYRHIERLRLFTPKENMLSYLYRKWAEAGEDLQKPLCITEKRAVIADELGITVRTVCRILSSLKEEGLITTEKNGNIHCSPEQLVMIRKMNLI